MDINVYIVKERKCPVCGGRGHGWDVQREIVNVFGLLKYRYTGTFHCFNDHEQVHFAVRTVREVSKQEAEFLRRTMHIY